MYRGSDAPVNAIRQSNEFIDLGKRESALEILYEAIKARRVRSWRPAVEDAMNNYLSLCLSLLSSQSFRDGVIQYRLLCQTSNVTSFENTLNKFFTSTLESSEKSWNQARETVLAEDLDQLETPETVLLKSISETTQQDRTDRLMLSPILKFTWESFKCILDICKNNKNLEKFYGDMAKKCYKFLLKYNRKTEFRKLCDATSYHLTQINRFAPNQLSLSFNDVQSIEILLNVRLEQLDTAISMELWVEAFGTMEDIHFIMRQNKKTLQPRILAIYYQKIALVFSKTNAHLFHAIALHKLYILIKEQRKGIKPEEMLKISSRVLAAVISIPMNSDIDTIQGFLLRYTDNLSNIEQLSAVLGINKLPQKSVLIEEVIKTSVLEYACPNLVNIFHAINRNSTSPFLCDYVNQQISKFPENLVDLLSSYTDSIRKSAFCALLKRISYFYQNIEIKKIVKLSIFYNFDEVLSILLECSRNSFLDFTINGHDYVVYFRTGLPQNGGYLANNVNKSISCLISKIHEVNFLACKKDCIVQIRKDIVEFNENNIILSEIFRYQKIQENISKYSDKISKEHEQINKENFEKMEEERTRMEELENIRLEEERKKRDEEKMLRTTKEKKLCETKKEAQEFFYNQHAKQMFKHVEFEELEKNISKYIKEYKEYCKKEIDNNIERMTNIEQYFDVLLYVIRKEEEKPLQEFIDEHVIERQKSWQRREDAVVNIDTKRRQTEIDFKTKLTIAKNDIEVILQKSENNCIQIFENLNKEFDKLIEEERRDQLIKAKAERIQQRKLQKISELKEIYEKINPPKREIPRKSSEFANEENQNQVKKREINKRPIFNHSSSNDYSKRDVSNSSINFQRPSPQPYSQFLANKTENVPPQKGAKHGFG